MIAPGEVVFDALGTRASLIPGPGEGTIGVGAHDLSRIDLRGGAVEGAVLPDGAVPAPEYDIPNRRGSRLTPPALSRLADLVRKIADSGTIEERHIKAIGYTAADGVPVPLDSVLVLDLLSQVTEPEPKIASAMPSKPVSFEKPSHINGLLSRMMGR